MKLKLVTPNKIKIIAENNEKISEKEFFEILENYVELRRLRN